MKKEASTETQHKLKSLYCDPRHGFTSISKFYKTAKEAIPDVTLAQVKSFLEKQHTVQVNREVKKPREFNTILASCPRECFQMDIIIYDRYEINNYKYILCCLDVHSRFAQARAMTNRENSSVLKNIQSIFKVMGIPKNLNADNEFNTTLLNGYFKRNNITCHFSEVGEINKNAIVERFNRTLAGLYQKWRQATKQRTWYKVLPDIIDNYNDSYHRTIKAKPNDVFLGKDNNKQYATIVINPPAFKVGDIVRYKETKSILGKGDYVKFSEDTYQIKEIKGKKYKLVSTKTGKSPSRMYKDYELKLAGEIQTFEEKPKTEAEYKQAKRVRKIQSERLDVEWANKKKLRSGAQWGEWDQDNQRYKTYLKQIDAPEVIPEQHKKVLRSKKTWGSR